MDRQKYDLIVIGTGVAGFKVAAGAAARGLKVAAIERWRVGGTCLNFGCDPIKAMHRCAEVAHLARRSERFGIRTGEVEVDFPRVMNRMRETIREFRGPQSDCGLAEKGVDYIKGDAHFLNAHMIQVNDQTFWADQMVVAAGGSPILPDIPGLDDVCYLTNETLFGIPELPQRLLCLGGGQIGCELGQIFSRLGSDVTIIERAPHLMRTEDPEIAVELAEYLQEEGIRIFVNACPERLVALENGPGLVVDVSGEKETFAFDEILIGVGRQANVRGLNLISAGVMTTERGIAVDSELRTSAQNIWACGDIIGHENYSNLATLHAEVVLENILDDAHRKLDETLTPWAVYTDPSIAHVGKTEEEARNAGYEVEIATLKAAGLPRAMTDDEKRGQAKMVVDAETGKILGATLLCYHAGEIINEIAMAMRGGLTVHDIAEIAHAYPTMSQIVQGLARRVHQEEKQTIQR